MLLVSFYTLLETECLMFPGVLERDQWQELGYDHKTNFSKIQQLKVLDMH